MPAEPSARRPSHLPLLDPLRILASVAVVRHHMRQDFLFGVGFGLPLFLVIMFALAASSTKREPLGRFARRKARYLLVPWLRWSLLYLALAVAGDTARGLGPAARLEPEMLLYGGHRSLWFLPFAALCLPLVRLVQRAAERLPVRAAVLGLAVLGALATNGVELALTHRMPDMPCRAWLRVAPAIAWGVAVGQARRATSDGERQGLLVAVAALAVGAYWASPWRGAQEDVLRRFGAAVPLACLGFALRAPVPRAVRELSTVTFGVYLVHPLIGKVLGTAFDPTGWDPALHTALAWLGAAAVVLALRRAPLHLHECWGAAARGASLPGPEAPAARRRVA